MNRELLEADDTPDTLKWQATQNERARAVLHGLPAYEPFRRRLLSLATRTKAAPLVRAGDLWFQRDEREFGRVLVRTEPDGPPRVLFDAGAVAHESGAPARLEWYAPSPDGALVAMGVEVAGSETSNVMVMDVGSGERIRADIPWVPAWPVSWLPDSSGFFVDARNVTGGEFLGEEDSLYLYRLSQPAPRHPEQLPAAVRFPRAYVSAEGRYTTLVVDNRTDHLRHSDGRWRPFLHNIPGMHIGEFAGDDFVAIVTDGHPRGRIVRMPVATASDPETWHEIVPECDDVLLGLSVFSDRMVVGMLRDLSTVIEVRDLDGALISRLDLPEHGTAGGVYATAGHVGEPPFVRSATEISFTFSTPTSSAAVYRYEVAEDRLTRVAAPAVELDGVTVRRITAVSADGTRVPATAIVPESHTPGVPLPTVVEGYGNFGLAMLPSFNSFAVPLLEAGGAYVIAHLRGGGEFGLDWWEQGRLGNKQHTFDDLFAIAGELVSTGLTTPGSLAFHGASGGGLTAGAAIAQHPELFRAVVARSPVLDLMNRMGDPFQDSIASREFGSVRDPVQAGWMRAYSPVHHVRAGLAYPACLFVAGENDPRCKPWQSRKMAALVAAATSGQAPVLLRVHGNRGHAAIGAEAFAQETAEWLAFIADQIALTPRTEPEAAGHRAVRAVVFRADTADVRATGSMMPGQASGDAGGLPPNSTTTHFENAAERTDAGVWQCEPCEWQSMDMGARAEFFHVTEGTIVLREQDGTVLEAPAGTSVYSPPGWSGQWRVPHRLTKVYVSFFPTRRGLGQPQAS
ncbi:prolyl oligopeptidase family serine peptidase [Streptomyces sp. NRRL F-5126]|uniref:prolyl oligopeptidase family serine peptidase n=1 Tax=Streptomyces sp. NRRL F-5126 TaxID=1463857 RepID=UPI0004C9AB8F|nr:prolyl oligopeptidase family serine peptidase [Streptomyces sp. NRRL F-5126]